MPPNTNAQLEPMNQIVERINSANNVLVTVNSNPSVDQLAACIGLTLALNKKGKHATAVFSGEVPSTLEFLQPEHTIEKNTDSLRDFIISLDKSKADKLRYKVEDDFVKIFITPYRTSIDDKDLAFSQGDFNIDLIITLGVHDRAQLDATIVAHGRILHDAPVVSLNTDTLSDLGATNWVDTESSSLCEMTSDLVMEIGRELLDAQIATALLTGMVAETDRFGNEKAHPHTMSISGVLMAAGASPQLISNKLQEPVAEPEVVEEPEEPQIEIPEVVEEESTEEEPQAEPEVEETEEEPEEPSSTDGMIEIDHSSDDDIHIDENGRLKAIKELEEAQAALEAEAQAAQVSNEPEQPVIEETEAPQPEPTEPVEGRLVLDPPQLGGQLTANSVPEYEQYSPSTDPLSVASPTPLLERTDDQVAEPDVIPEATTPDQTLADLERSLDSPHVQEAENDVPPLDEARAAVEGAVDASDVYRPEPINALGATPVDLNLGHNPLDLVEDENTPTESHQDDSNNSSPPPVPPPMMPPSGV